MKLNLSSYSNFTQRLVAAIVGVSIIISATIYGSLSYWLLFVAISAFTQIEFYRLSGMDGNSPLTYYGTFCGVMLNLLAYMIELEKISEQSYFLMSPLLTFIFFIKLYKKDDTKPFTNIAYTFLGIIYVALPFALVTVMALQGGVYSYQKVLGCLFLLWASDTGGYFAGKYLGKRKLFERVSPKKTWEGSLGSMIAAMLVAAVISRYFIDILAWKWFVIGVIIVVTGTYGDLVESLFKRSIHIKDSGSIIPGHGGFLDRFDGLLLSASFIVMFLKMF